MVITWGFVIRSAASKRVERLEWQPRWVLEPSAVLLAWRSVVDFGPSGKLSEKYLETHVFGCVKSVLGNTTTPLS